MFQSFNQEIYFILFHFIDVLGNPLFVRICYYLPILNGTTWFAAILRPLGQLKGFSLRLLLLETRVNFCTSSSKSQFSMVSTITPNLTVKKNMLSLMKNRPIKSVKIWHTRWHPAYIIVLQIVNKNTDFNWVGLRLRPCNTIFFPTSHFITKLT